MKTKKKFLTILLTVCLVMAMIPMTVLAADEAQTLFPMLCSEVQIILCFPEILMEKDI